MANWKVYPYKQGSGSARALAKALNGRVLKVDGGKWKPREGDGSIVVNWGSSQLDVNRYPTTILNKPEAIAVASNKLKSFQTLHEFGVPIPKFYTSKEHAVNLFDGRTKVVCRTVLSGHSGAGIVIANNPDELVDAPLYTEYLQKKQEFRVHVFRDQAFFVQRKARNRAIPDDQVNWQVRNHQNGFIYAHKDIEYPDDIRGTALNAVQALGLDFGAVDILLGSKNRIWVLEVNTACGLEGTTLEKYKEVFQGAFE